ncbi:acyl carrier protein [Rhizobium rhizosphaerae]|uniref:Acyl carrier protein n=1 Tax=Xaviernesmea rhizosphaerae TaxID=1672749 RepID=A0A1Q9AE99_9HYPH|nr:acyl carrier protein [Xaviernesmea rhizosphaerae]OLP53216.1 acyl carrier protein [Xaviernesmea rhizosphaerae]OQP85839.1 acyl carrier protein [Xaviernesmea rhizosphaerae]
MSNRETYDSAFTETFMIEAKDLPGLKYQGVAAWDSVGHMALMAALEEAFGIEMDIDDIIEFSGYEAGQAILSKYNVAIEPAA